MTLKLPPQYNKPRLLDMIRYMGRMYDADIEGIDEFVKFQEILDNIDSDKKTGIFDMQARLGALAPKCSDIVKKCKWGGAEVDCAKIIKTKLTYEGFCCTFNYMRASTFNETYEAPQIAAGIGPDMGLTVLLNLSVVDYAYQFKNFPGATALIFDPDEFADSASGSVREVPIERFVETRITINCMTKKAVEDVQRYSIEKRECLFPTDMMSEYGGNYVYGDCLTKCKLKSVIALCKCFPFNMPTNFPDIEQNLPFCSLSNVQCMNKYKVKWATYKPREYIKVLEREMEDSINCVDCYPLCSSTTYIVDSTAAKLNFYYQNKGSVM
jgi:amiloride-sensitive sodium channel